MRLAVMSDVHGNLAALNAVLDDLKPQDVNGVIVAGDLIGGPQPNETICLLRNLDVWMIRGNSDHNLIRYATGRAPDDWRTSHQFELLRWAHRNVNEKTLDFLRSLPEQLVVEIPGTASIRVVHGSPRDPAESIFPDRAPHTLDLALSQTDEPVLVCGHTHIPWKRERGGRLALNPGSVCGPLNGDVRAQYALLSWHDDHWEAIHRAAPYDLEQIRAAFRDSGLLHEGGALARAFLLSIETGKNIAEDFLQHAYRLATEAGHESCATVPNAAWERAAETFHWEAVEKQIQ